MTHAPEADGSNELEKAAPSRRRGRRHGIEIRPGSVKQARLQAGLSLGKIARDDISRTAIYFVETGKAKPSLETLHLIAERTGRPVEFFLTAGSEVALSPTLQLAELERMLATGDNAGVAAAADKALRHQPDPDTTARIELLASMAHLRLAQPAVGRRLAASARAHFERVGNFEMTAEALGNDSQGAMLMQDPSAVSIAEAALALCRSLKPVPRAAEARLLRVLGHSLVSTNRWQEAIESYEQAIDAADVLQDLQQMSLVYSGLSVAYQETSHIAEAVRYAQKALTIHEMLHDRLSTARSLNNLGWMLLYIGQFETARAHITKSLAILEEQGVEAQKSIFLMTLADLELAENNLVEAARVAHAVLDLASLRNEQPTVAEAHTMLGKIAEREGRSADADREFEAALSAAEPIGGPRLMDVHEAYAGVLEARGDLATANRHLRHAIAAFKPATPALLGSRIAIA